MTKPVPTSPSFDVAVIVPTHNRATMIGDALDSIAAQTILKQGRRIEVAVIDDGSTDDTAGVIKPYLQRFGAPEDSLVIRYTRLEKQGVVTARNRGIADTSAPNIAFLDSDDAWSPDKLEKQLTLLDADPDAGVVHTAFVYMDDRGRKLNDAPQRPDNPCRGRCLDVLLDEDLVIFSSVLMRRSVIERIAAAEPHGLPFDPRWTNAQDYDLLLRAARLCAFAYVPEALTLYRLHGGHGAMGNFKRAFGYHCRVQMDFVARHGGNFGWDEAEGRRRAAKFLFSRAQAEFWKRHLNVARDLCDLAKELHLSDSRFDELRRKATRPTWIYRVKDGLDRMFGRGGAA